MADLVCRRLPTVTSVQSPHSRKGDSKQDSAALGIDTDDNRMAIMVPKYGPQLPLFGH